MSKKINYSYLNHSTIVSQKELDDRNIDLDHTELYFSIVNESEVRYYKPFSANSISEAIHTIAKAIIFASKDPEASLIKDLDSLVLVLWYGLSPDSGNVHNINIKCCDMRYLADEVEKDV